MSADEPTGALTGEPHMAPAQPELPELPQRVRGATLTPHYIDAEPRDTRSRFAPPRHVAATWGGRVPTITLDDIAPASRYSQAGLASLAGLR